MNSPNKQIFSHEKVAFNLIKYQKFGKTFEIAVDPDLAIEYRQSRDRNNDELKLLLRAEKIFSDTKKGLLAAEHEIKEVFGTDDFLEIAKKIAQEGEIQLTAEHREKLREEKKRKIINMIHRSAIDPKTNLPHPHDRIESAMNEAKVKIDEFKKAEDQVQDIVHKLKPIIAIKISESLLMLDIPIQYASKLRQTLQAYGKMDKETWGPDGLTCRLKIPAGLTQEFMDEINSRTHGSVHIEIGK